MYCTYIIHEVQSGPKFPHQIMAASRNATLTDGKKGVVRTGSYQGNNGSGKLRNEAAARARKQLVGETNERSTRIEYEF